MAHLTFVPAAGQRGLPSTDPIMRLVAGMQNAMAAEPSDGWSCGNATLRLAAPKGSTRKQRRLTIHVTQERDGQEVLTKVFWGPQTKIVADLSRWLARQHRDGRL